MTSRWSRTFSRLATFSGDLGDLGASVVESTSVRHEDIVLRRLLIAQKRAGALRFPFEVDARHDAPSTPDFVVKDTVGRRYLKVAGAGHIEPGTNGNDPCDLVVYHTDGAMSTNAVADQRAFCRAGGYGRVHTWWMATLCMWMHTVPRLRESMSVTTTTWTSVAGRRPRSARYASASGDA